MKRKRFIKPLCLVLAAALTLLGVPLSASAEAGEYSVQMSQIFNAVTIDTDNGIVSYTY